MKVGRSAEKMFTIACRVMCFVSSSYVRCNNGSVWPGIPPKSTLLINNFSKGKGTGRGGGGESFPYLTFSLIGLILSVFNNSGCCYAALLLSTQKRKKVYILRFCVLRFTFLITMTYLLLLYRLGIYFTR